MADSFDLNAFLPYQLAAASARVSRMFADHYRAEFGIGIAEWRVLAHLAQSGTVSVREICAQVDMDKPRVSRAVARLEAAGYLTKAANAGDRRLVDLALTPGGRDLLCRILPMAHRFQAEMITRLGEDAPGLRRALTRLISEE